MMNPLQPIRRRMAFVLVTLLVGCSSLFQAVTVEAATPVRVMSFNLRYDGGWGWPSKDADAWVVADTTTDADANRALHRRDLAVQVIKDFSPDVLGVQEALHNQMSDLAAGLTGYTHYGIGRTDGKEEGEYASLYFRTDRYELTNKGSFWLSETPDEPSKVSGAGAIRIASWVQLTDHENDDRSYLVLNSHWDHVSDHARLLSATLIRQKLVELMVQTVGGQPSEPLPLIVMGDLNQTEESKPIKMLMGQGGADGLQLIDSYRQAFPTRSADERTFHGFKGGNTGSRIDYVFHTSRFRTAEASIIRTNTNGQYPSDHYPVTAVLELTP